LADKFRRSASEKMMSICIMSIVKHGSDSSIQKRFYTIV